VTAPVQTGSRRTGCPYCGPDGAFSPRDGCQHVLVEMTWVSSTYRAEFCVVPDLIALLLEWSSRLERLPGLAWGELSLGIPFWEDVPPHQVTSDQFQGANLFVLVQNHPGITIWHPTDLEPGASELGSSYALVDPDRRLEIAAGLHELQGRLVVDRERWSTTAPPTRPSLGVENPYDAAFREEARRREGLVEGDFAYYCPFCDAEKTCYFACIGICDHLVRLGIPGGRWEGPYEFQCQRLLALVADAAFDGVDLPELFGGIAFWLDLTPPHWAAFDESLMQHPLLLDLPRDGAPAMHGERGDVHVLLVGTDVKARFDTDFEALTERMDQRPMVRARRLKMFEAPRFGTNEAPRVVEHLSSNQARDLLLRALDHSEAAARGAVYVATMAIHGHSRGGGSTGGLSHLLVQRVKHVVDAGDAEGVLVAARHHEHAAVRDAVEACRRGWN
jgi:hypothetical protein